MRRIQILSLDSGRQACCDPPRDLVLDGKDILEIAIVALGPKVAAAPGIDELRRHPDALASSPDAAFRKIAHAELPADLPQIQRAALVGKGRIARDDEQRAEARKLGDDIFSDPVGKIFLQDRPACW